jgi:putative FmdB family regulatory protein
MKCGNVFEKILVRSDDKADMECPDCRSDVLERVVSRTSHKMARGSGEQPRVTTRSCGSGGSCLSVDIPGPTK